MDLQETRPLITGGGHRHRAGYRTDLPARGAHANDHRPPQECSTRVGGRQYDRAWPMDVTQRRRRGGPRSAAAVKSHGPDPDLHSPTPVLRGKAVHKTDMEFLFFYFSFFMAQHDAHKVWTVCLSYASAES